MKDFFKILKQNRPSKSSACLDSESSDTY